MCDTCTWIADEVIFGKEISKSVKCLKKKTVFLTLKKGHKPETFVFLKKHLTLFDISPSTKYHLINICG